MNCVTLQNEKILLDVDLEGGSYVNYQLKSLPLNPLNWELSDPDFPPFRGHFVCFDRWGPPSDMEKAKGALYHGEATSVKWDLLSLNHTDTNSLCKVSCVLPMGGLQLIREIKLGKDLSCFRVIEEIKNLNRSGRLYNLVQHVTIAPPILDQSTIFDNNTKKGYVFDAHKSAAGKLSLISWTDLRQKDGTVRIQQLQKEWPSLASFVFPENQTYGWATACNPSRNILIGYVWKLQHYPWINYWHDFENGIPRALGMEFGTSGLHQPFRKLVEKGKIFNKSIYEYLDPGESITKSFISFISLIPDDYTGVQDIQISGSVLSLKENHGHRDDLMIELGDFVQDLN